MVSEAEKRCLMFKEMSVSEFKEHTKGLTREQIEDDPCLSLVIRRRKYPKYQYVR